MSLVNIDHRDKDNDVKGQRFSVIRYINIVASTTMTQWKVRIYQHHDENNNVMMEMETMALDVFT